MEGHLTGTNQATSSCQKDTRFEDYFLSLQELDTDLYMAAKSWKTSGARGTYGGLIIGQALIAASRTVSDALNLHSMHSYFLRAGDPKRPTIYRVLRTRDGSSFSSRTVSAIQNGRPILTLQASFHNEGAEAPSLLEYQPVMPTTEHHKDLLNVGELLDQLMASENLTSKQKAAAERFHKFDLPIHVKPVNPAVYMRLAPNPDHTMLSWVKVPGDLGNFSLSLN